MTFNKSKFENSLDETREEIIRLKKKYGSLEDIPLKEKEKIVESQRKNLPILNGIHISLLTEEIKHLKFEVAMLEFAMIILGIFILVNIVLK